MGRKVQENNGKVNLSGTICFKARVTEGSGVGSETDIKHGVQIPQSHTLHLQRQTKKP